MAPTGGQRSPTGLNPNAKRSSDRQVAASNSTLNTWVGGRQPSWLANAKPVKPSPRPPQPSKQPINTEPTRPIVTTVQPASVSISAPGTTTSAVATATTTTTTTAPPRRPHQSPRPPLQTTQTSASAAHTVLPSPAPSDEPSPDIAESQSALPTTEAHFALDSSVDVSREKQAQPRVSTVRTRTGSRQGKDISLSPRISTPANMALNTPPTPNMPSINTHVTPNIAPREHLEQPPAKRRCVENPSLRFLQSFKAAQRLQIQVQLRGGEQNLESQVERPRYQLLGEACAEGDLFFVALHQLFCLWAMSQSNVHQLCDERVHNPSLIDSAFGTMGTLLKSNSKLRPDHLQWFASFPAPLQTLQRVPAYSSVIKQVLDFLVCVAHKWIALHHDHQMKGYPLLMSELLDGLLLYSPILQAILFRASRRSLGITDGPAAVQIEALFKNDQRQHRNANGTFARRPLSAEYQNYNSTLIRDYKLIIAQHQPPQEILQGVQRPTPSVPPTVQQPGLSYPPHMNPQMGQMSPQMNPQGNPQMSPQIPQHGRQAPRYLPSMVPLRSNSVSEGSHGNQFLHSQSPIDTQLIVPSSSPVSDDAFFLSPVTTQFPIPSHHHIAYNNNNNQANIAPLPSAVFSQQINTNPQAQLNHPSRQVQASSMHSPHLLNQQMQMRLSQRAANIVPSLQHTPNPMGLYQAPFRPIQPMQPTGQRPQGPQDYGGRPRLVQQSIPSPGVNHAGFNANPNAMNAQPAPPYFTNHFQGSNLHRQQSFNPRPRQSIPNKSDRFIPAPGLRIGAHEYPHSPYDKRSVEMSLHQAHLRSPKRIPLELGSARSERYYQAVKCFVLFPVAVPPHPHLYKFKFTVTDLDHARIARDEKRPGDVLPVNRFSSGSLRFRVRCCYGTKSSTPFSESSWVTTDTTWPEHIFMELNRNTLSVMRKTHYGKDLPIEASSFIIPGDNFLNVHIPQGILIPQGKEPWVAVEVVEVLSHSAVLHMVKMQGSLPSSVTRDTIKRRLSGPPSEETDDDELKMVDELSIDVTDPFSRTVFGIPVRGKNCTHLECFDLEIWLNTRLGKKSCHCHSNAPCGNCPNEPSFVDKWKCPLCDGDARPYSLRIDEFLVDVRSQLEKENKLRTKSILVSADGTWKPKEDPGDDSDIDSDEDDVAPGGKKPSRSSTAPVPRDRPTIEVIELD
ncbi:hypothetical protein F4776DRAFT_663496 [Hypoxylon sp. NC0597]|nr:hypothetical protein F4776DRAFT_663496 [Hypoxylon sp. NC0597]